MAFMTGPDRRQRGFSETRGEAGSIDPELSEEHTEPRMKAVVFHQHGPLDNLRYEDFPDPQLQPDEILIKVGAVALNGFDPMVLRGIPGLKTPLPMIPGADIAGEIAALGADVDRRWKPGQRVVVIPNQADGMMG